MHFQFSIATIFSLSPEPLSLKLWDFNYLQQKKCFSNFKLTFESGRESRRRKNFFYFYENNKKSQGRVDSCQSWLSELFTLLCNYAIADSLTLPYSLSLFSYTDDNHIRSNLQKRFRFKVFSEINSIRHIKFHWTRVSRTACLTSPIDSNETSMCYQTSADKLFIDNYFSFVFDSIHVRPRLEQNYDRFCSRHRRVVWYFCVLKYTLASYLYTHSCGFVYMCSTPVQKFQTKTIVDHLFAFFESWRISKVFLNLWSQSD